MNRRKRRPSTSATAQRRRERKATSEARVRKLHDLRRDLWILRQMQLGKFPFPNDAYRRSLEESLYDWVHAEITRQLDKEPAWRQTEEHILREMKVREAHQRGDKLTIDGAFKTASKELRGHRAKAGPDMIKKSHQLVQKHQKAVREMTGKVAELSKKLRGPQG